MEPVIALTQVGKRFRSGKEEYWAVKNVSFEIREGEFVVLTGRSGSGKSTLLNVIGAIDECSEGMVEILGEKIYELSDKRKTRFRLQNVSFIFQDFGLLPFLSAFENIEFPLLLSGWSRKQRTTAVQESAELVGIQEKLKSKPHELSGGQQQRVAIARAIACKTPLLLADEMTANLDEDNAKQILSLLKNLQHINNTTILVASHDPLVKYYSHREIEMSDGKTVNDHECTVTAAH